MRITDVVQLVNGGKRRERMLAVAVMAAVTATLVPALGATGSTASRAGAARAVLAPTPPPRPRPAAHPGFRRQGREHGRPGRTVKMSAIPALRRGTRPASPARAVPLGVGTSNARFAALQAAARTSSVAPRPAQAAHRPPTVADSNRLYTPMDTKAFSGQSDSATTCPYSGCAPPDQGLAASSNYEVQVVNTAIGIWKNGVAVTGFPKSLQAFFAVPSPSPAGCDSRGPFLTDPRAAYDPNANRFYVTIMQVEGGLGVGTGCTPTSTVWFAVSATSNPAGAWHVYSMAINGTSSTAFSNYTQFGFDTQGLYWSFNLFNKAGTALVNNVVIGVRKAELLTGAAPKGYFFTGLNVSGKLLDTVNPVESLARNAGPQGEIFVDSYNINFGGGNCSGGCSGLVVWDFSNIAFSGSTIPSLTGATIASDSYTLPPMADNPPSCSACLETLDTRISATPIYQHGQVYAGIDTAVNNGSGKNVPGILWFDVSAYLNPGPTTCPECTTINGSTNVMQQGYFFFSGAADAFFPTLIPDAEGNLMMGFEFSSSADSIDPSQAYAGRRVTLPPGTMSDGGIFAIKSAKASTQFRQGDYGASSWTGSANDATWSTGEYSCPATGDWCTEIWRNTWTISSN
jgi:hypothetical protein